jgi:hypothetical protein
MRQRPVYTGRVDGTQHRTKQARSRTETLRYCITVSMLKAHIRASEIIILNAPSPERAYRLLWRGNVAQVRSCGRRLLANYVTSGKCATCNICGLCPQKRVYKRSRHDGTSVDSDLRRSQRQHKRQLPCCIDGFISAGGPVPQSHCKV